MKEIKKRAWVYAEEACEIMGISNVTLTRWRARGYGPAAYKKGGRCLYSRNAIHKFMVTPDGIGIQAGELLYDQENGEGQVTLNDKFLDHNPLLKMDCLNDMIDVLESEHEKATEDWKKEMISLGKTPVILTVTGEGDESNG